jgi:ABC-type sugar transport system ATPase subunit
LNGRVDLVEALGSEQLIHFTTDASAVQVTGAHEEDAAGLDQGTIRQGGEGVARIDTRAPVRAGDTIAFSIEPGRLRFFDPDTAWAIGSTPAVNGSESLAQSEPGGTEASYAE